MMKKLLLFGILLVLVAALLMGCPQQKPVDSGTVNASSGQLKPADVPAYNDSIDSDIDNLSASLG